MKGWITKLLATVVLLTMAAMAHPAFARDAVRASCHAGGNLVPDVDHPRLPPVSQWKCEQGDFATAPQVAWVFFTPDDFAMVKAMPSHFVSDIARFDRINLIAMNGNGPIRSRSYDMADVSEYANGPKFALPLPDMRGATGLVVAIEKPWSPVLPAQARLQSRHGPKDALGWNDDAMLAVALLLGLLCAPFAYHAVFARILRESFVPWQMATMASLLGLVLLYSGLAHHVMDIRLGTAFVLMALAIAATPFFATLFFLSYLEEDALSERMRKLVLGTATAMTVICGFVVLPIEGLRACAQVVFITGQALTILTVGVACVLAVRAGSRAVRIQIPFWTALTLAGFVYALQLCGASAYPDGLEELFFAAIAANVATGSFAVIYRVDIMRRDRERVNARLDALTNLIDLDPLTGIYNRRAFEQRFAELRSDGFHALAVVDLDHFKRINDRFGHATGDRVLQEVAAVLAGDKNAIAFRMGGEEFVVMLRGSHILQRAEQLRSSIAIRVANEVEGIDGPVTASMGLIESPPGGASTMRQLYAHADRLLYEAKYSGRNRLISERIQVFETPSRERRARDRRRGDRRENEKTPALTP